MALRHMLELSDLEETIMSMSLDLSVYCTHVPVQERLRLDLFTERAFRRFENDRTRILFFCGKLDLAPH